MPLLREPSWLAKARLFRFRAGVLLKPERPVLRDCRRIIPAVEIADAAVYALVVQVIRRDAE
jgi:hypothetical protein